MWILRVRRWLSACHADMMAHICNPGAGEVDTGTPRAHCLSTVAEFISSRSSNLAHWALLFLPVTSVTPAAPEVIAEAWGQQASLSLSLALLH